MPTYCLIDKAQLLKVYEVLPKGYHIPSFEYSGGVWVDKRHILELALILPNELEIIRETDIEFAYKGPNI